MKVLVIVGGFLPAKKYGGPVVSVDNLCTLLQDEIEFYILAMDHDLGDFTRLSGIKPGWNKRKNCKVRYLSTKEMNFETYETIVAEIIPDCIYINSLFDAIFTVPFLKIAKKESIRVLLAPRGQLCKNAFIKKYKKIPYILYLKINNLLSNIFYQSTSDEETRAIIHYLGGRDDRIYNLTNLPSIPSEVFEYSIKEKGTAKFIFLSRIVPKKNLHQAISCFERINGNITFDIYGPIEDESYWNECKNTIRQLPSNISINYCGLISHDDIFSIFSKYDAFLFPTLSENFGHVISEALFSGCPVIVSDQTPWRNLEKKSVGWDIRLDDIDFFVEKIQGIVEMDDNNMKLLRNNALEYVRDRFDLSRLKQDYKEALLPKNY